MSSLIYAHTPAIECANQIVDYFNDHREFDAFHFNEFVSELRSTSQLLIIQGRMEEARFSPQIQTTKRWLYIRLKKQQRELRKPV